MNISLISILIFISAIYILIFKDFRNVTLRTDTTDTPTHRDASHLKTSKYLKVSLPRPSFTSRKQQAVVIITGRTDKKCRAIFSAYPRGTAGETQNGAFLLRL